ncbi:hypothetical protein D6D04_07431 [Aureobasidium pullulans]|nr:hypothetical protein D6D04_07431 [Aureobasidium pullulans]
MTRMNLCHVNTSNQSALEALRLKLHVSRAGSVNLRATDCEYTVAAGQSQRQATNKQLEAYKYVLDRFRQGSVSECRGLLLSLKSHGSVAEAVEYINRDRWTRGAESAGEMRFEPWDISQ